MKHFILPASLLVLATATVAITIGLLKAAKDTDENLSTQAWLQTQYDVRAAIGDSTPIGAPPTTIITGPVLGPTNCHAVEYHWGNNPVDAEAKYVNKRHIVTGQVSIIELRGNHIALALSDGWEGRAQTWHFFDKTEHANKIAKLRTMQYLTIEGIGKPYGNFVDCKIIGSK
jgi:hypothetical protein